MRAALLAALVAAAALPLAGAGTGLFAQEAKLTASDGADFDLFGEAVDRADGAALVGAVGVDGYTGAAYVHDRLAPGVWEEAAKLEAPDGETQDAFGASVSLEGDTALVGSPLDDNVEGEDAGAVYIYTRNATGAWNQDGKLTPAVVGPDDEFGMALSRQGDTLLVGAPENEGGTAHLYTRNATGAWNEGPVLIPDDGEANDEFGTAVALGDGVAVVGAWGEDEKGDNAGAAYAFVRNDTGAWNQEAKLTASDADGTDWFGYAVDLDGETALVGALFGESGGQQTGTAYVFDRAGGSWDQQAKLAPSDGDLLGDFGTAVRLEDGTAVVGSAEDDNDNGEDAGAAYVFVRDPELGWSERDKIVPVDGEGGDEFGEAVALRDGEALVGASSVDTDGGKLAGAVYAYTSAEGLAST